MSVWKDAIWLTSCSRPRVSMATLSSEWGHGSNWPIVSKLHFSEWFPQSCYWNRAPAPLMDTSCHSQFKRQEGKVQTWHAGVLVGVGVGAGTAPVSLKQKKVRDEKKKTKNGRAAASLHDVVVQLKEAVDVTQFRATSPLPPPRPRALRSPVCLSHG